ncbi:hypothetical protein PVAG01_04565 [Phlyctema vagabunda]|uniref:Uncharacterized protein n=1 Tax=Phlyctema vagabunda TaxID=108571 RepID=A0ABR4PHK3_9HELO
MTTTVDFAAGSTAIGSVGRGNGDDGEGDDPNEKQHIKPGRAHEAEEETEVLTDQNLLNIWLAWRRLPIWNAKVSKPRAGTQEHLQGSLRLKSRQITPAIKEIVKRLSESVAVDIQGPESSLPGGTDRAQPQHPSRMAIRDTAESLGPAMPFYLFGYSNEEAMLDMMMLERSRTRNGIESLRDTVNEALKEAREGLEEEEEEEEEEGEGEEEEEEEEEEGEDRAFLPPSSGNE